MRRICHYVQFLFLSLVLVLGPVRASVAQDLPELYLFDDLFQIMAAEGISASGDENATPLDPTELGQWRANLERIYDASRLEANFVAALEQALEGRADVTEDAIAFAQSPLGERVLRLEVSAREALLDNEIDEMARLALMEAREADSDSAAARRLALVRERIEVNNLVELNVSLGLNTSYAYYTGMLSETDLPGLEPQDVLTLVWAQEEDVRADVGDWIESYFLMAYQPLSDDDLRAYIDWSGSALGDAFNRAMFLAFDTVFVDISRQVGTALGRALSGQSL